MALKETLELQGYKNIKKRVFIALVILIMAIIIFAIVTFYVFPKECGDSNCFANAIANCKKVSWVKEDSRASWYYRIIGSSPGEACRVKIKLLNMKEGTIDTEELQGNEMICIVQKGDTRFPEEDMKKCSGLLKEELQGIIIERMHNYLLKNIGEIKEGFGV